MQTVADCGLKHTIDKKKGRIIMTTSPEKTLLIEELGFPFNILNRGLHSADSVLYGKRAKNEMKVDIQERETGYSIDIDLPGYKKEQISLELENGSLTVKAEKRFDREEKDDSGRLIHRERFTGEMQRSFAVGDTITEEDITAVYTDGVLHIELPKPQEQPIPEARRIRIEG